MLIKHTCKNGVRIVLEQIPSVRSVAIGIWIHVGSRKENEKNNGISHFIEHMFFKGTKTRSAREIAETFDRIGGQVNAFTSKEYTCYYAKVLDNHAPLALEVLSDMFFHSSFDEGEMNKEKNVVLEEIKMYEDTPDDLVHDLLAQASFCDHPLAYPILGNEKTLQSFTPEDLKNYINSKYRPEDVVISIAGNIDASFIERVEAFFGDYHSDEKQSIIHEVSPIFQPKSMVRKKETEQAHLCLGFQGLPIDDEKIYGLIVLNNIFGGSMSSRLFQEVREERGLAYSIYSYHTSYEDMGTLAIYGGTGMDQLETLYDTIIESIHKLKDKGISTKELENTKEQLKGSLMLSLESTNSRMSRNGKNELLLKKHFTLDEVVSRIDQVNDKMIEELIQFVFHKPFAVGLVNSDGILPSKFNHATLQNIL